MSINYNNSVKSNLKVSSLELTQVKTYTNTQKNYGAVIKKQDYSDIDIVDYDAVHLNKSEKKTSGTLNFFEERTKMEIQQYQQSVELGNTVANIFVSLGEGVIWFLESMVDVLVLMSAAQAANNSYSMDMAHGFVYGDWNGSASKQAWEDAMPIVGYEATDKAFDYLYEKTVLKDVNERANDIAKREDGVLYNIGKGVGYYTGAIAASTATAGAAGLSSAVGVQSAFMGAAKFGQSTQDGYNKLVTQSENGSGTISHVDIMQNVSRAGVEGIVEGGIFYTAGSLPISNKIVKDAAGAAVKATKSYITEGINSISTGEEYNFGAATLGAVSTLVAEGGGMIFKGVTGVYAPAETPTMSPDVIGGNYQSQIQTEISDNVAKTVENKVWKNVVNKTINTSIKKASEKSAKDASKAIFNSGIDAIGREKAEQTAEQVTKKIIDIAGQATAKTVAGS